MKRALTPKQRLGALGHVAQAITEIRKTIECAPDAGPLLVACYRCLSTLGELLETVDAMPEIPEERTT